MTHGRIRGRNRAVLRSRGRVHGTHALLPCTCGKVSALWFHLADPVRGGVAKRFRVDVSFLRTSMDRPREGGIMTSTTCRILVCQTCKRQYGISPDDPRGVRCCGVESTESGFRQREPVWHPNPDQFVDTDTPFVVEECPPQRE